MSDGGHAREADPETESNYLERHPELRKSTGLLGKYRPEVLDGYIALRHATFNTGPDAALSPKFKELIIIAIECARTKTNPPPIGHARRAIDAGATMQEIAEAVALCIPLAGMISYQESGRFVLEAAEERLRELAAAREANS
jgi:alkylhydroperoxidase/carboxymuconolactone decarboxylase family protein YurZ